MHYFHNFAILLSKCGSVKCSSQLLQNCCWILESATSSFDFTRLLNHWLNWKSTMDSILRLHCNNVMLKLILLHEQTNFTVYLLYAMTSATTCITADRTTDTPKPTNIFVLPQSSFSNGLPYSCEDHLDHF